MKLPSPRNRNTILIAVVGFFTILNFSCYKEQTTTKRINDSDAASQQLNFVRIVKNNLKNCLQDSDFTALDFKNLFRSRDVRSINYFVRLSFQSEKVSDDFILLKTDSIGNILNGSIINVRKKNPLTTKDDISMKIYTLDRKQSKSVNTTKQFSAITNTDGKAANTGNVSLSLAAPIDDDVIVPSYDDDDVILDYWILYDYLLPSGSGGGSSNTYGSLTGAAGGGGTGVQPDNAIVIDYEDASQPGIDISKYIKCFSLIPNQGATFKITIYSDLPVNSNPNTLFDWSTGACGHSFLKLTKSNGINSVQQNIGFYPLTGWKSVANSSVVSKIVDNGGHEYNASLTISVDATHFQNALNTMLSESTVRYDIDDFNCTDFALSVFNVAATTQLTVSKKHIPNGTLGTSSNTPQGLFQELSNLVYSGNSGGSITINTTTPGFAGPSHGACN